jgi:carbamoylphosphate synthase small subunit
LKPGSKLRSGFFTSTTLLILNEAKAQRGHEFENSCAPLIVGADVRALIALEDGRCFEGESFGATGTSVGEICFNTSMTGYQEVLTDPSYRGQIVAMTYPLIGNYGINSLDAESRSPHVRGFVIEELTEVPSNWRSEMSLDEYLRNWNIPGAKGIDTRALTRHLRTRGAMKSCLTTEEISPEEATRRAIDGEGVIGMDYVREVSTKKIYRWDPEDNFSTPSRGQIQHAMVDPKIAGWTRQANPSTNPLPNCGIRLWHEGKHSAPPSPESV